MKYIIQVLFALTIILTGCQSDYGVNKSGMEAWIKTRSTTALDSKNLSCNTIDFLLREGISEAYIKNPKKTLKALSTTLAETKNRKLLYTLIELTYMEAKKCTSPDEAAYYYLSACIYSYTYLFKENFSEMPSPYEPEFLFTCRFYNYSATKVFQYMINKDIANASNVNLPFLHGFVKFLKPVNHLPYKLEDLSSIEICYNYKPFGFHTLTRRSGLGIPLVMAGEQVLGREKKPTEIFDISKMAYPGTAFIRFITPKKGEFNATMEFYDPLNRDSITVNGEKIPLEIDLSTYLAWVLRGGPGYSPISAMMDTAAMKNNKGLYMLTPYDKNKIPVVFVHGVLSYPRTWVQTINTLLMDPKIREKYQFWLFAYPSGNPVLFSSLALRKSLLAAKKNFDPKGDNPNFKNMVIIGHSMGGLLSKGMIQNSGDVILKKLIGNKSLKDFNLTKKEELFVKEVLTYERLPFVKRVIFISTPHKGSTMTRWWVAKLAAKLINLPKELINEIYEIQEKIGLKTGTDTLKISTGVDNLDPDNKFIKISSKLQFDKNVTYHSIIGNNKKGGVPGGTDGIVEYSSAHLDDAASEIIIKSDHSAHEKPLAIKEIKRILHKHLYESR